MKNFVRAAIVLPFIMTTSTITYATEYHISPDDDWFPIIYGDHLQPGDEVILEDGVYSDRRKLIISHQGTTEAPIVIRAENHGKVVLTRPDARQNTVNIAGAQHFVLRGLEITGGSIGIRIGSKNIEGIKRQADFITIEKCHIHHTGEAAITANFRGDVNTGHKYLNNEIDHTGGTGEGFYLGSNNDGSGNTTAVFKDGLIEGNYIHHLDGSTISQGDGIEIKDGSYNNIIRDNVIHNIKYPGILVYGTDGNAPNIIEGNVIWSSGDNGIQAASDAVITNNIIIDSAASGIRSQNHQSAIPGNLTIVHNTVITNAGGNAIRVNRPAGGVLSGPIVIANNALYAVDSGLALRLQDLPGFTISGNTGVGRVQPAQDLNAWNPGGNLDLDFNDGTNKDLYLAEGSLLIGNADVDYTINYDFNGTERTHSLDVGALVYKPSGSAGWQIEPGFKETLESGLDSDGDGVKDSQDNCINIVNPAQWDTDLDGYGNRCDGDLNNDGSTNTLDLNLYIKHHRTREGEIDYNVNADFNSDGRINTLDFNIYILFHRNPPGPSCCGS